MKNRWGTLFIACALSAALLAGCSSDKKYTDEEYEANYQTGYDEGYSTGYDEGYAVGAEEAVTEDRARQVQTMNYETFRALNEQGAFSGIIYVGRAACPYCSLVTDYMRTITDLPIAVYYVSLEPYYNSPYYDDYKAELNIDSVPTFIYYKDGEPQYYMDSPVPDGYFDESGQDRVDGYEEMTERIRVFIEGCVDDNPQAVEEIWPDADQLKVRAAESAAAEEEAETAAETEEETQAAS